MNMHLPELQRQHQAHKAVQDRIGAGQHHGVSAFPSTSITINRYLSDKHDGYLHLISPEQYFYSETMMDATVRILAKYPGVTLALMRGDTRTKWMVKIRREIVIYCRDVLGKSYTQIASFLRKDHSSIINLYRKGKLEGISA